MSDVMTIPVFPCASLPETLAFYQALGFEVTHQQTSPYVYGAVRRGEVHVHFHGSKRRSAEDAFSMCLVIVPEVDRLHRTFVEGLRRAYGKPPYSGRPHITRMRKGLTRFSVVDVAGNSITFIERDEPDLDYDAAWTSSGSRLSRALAAAANLRDFQCRDEAAARVLDAALAKADGGTALERARALAARAELAIALGDPTRARALRAELDALALTDAERAQLQDDLDDLDALERSQQ